MTTNGTEPVRFLTPAEAARLVPCSDDLIRDEIRSGRLRAYKVGRLWTIDPDDFQAWRTARPAEVDGHREYRPRRDVSRIDKDRARLMSIVRGQA